ncbi:MAG: complex I subunit 4 family protein [Candidatus Hinthialibacter sp.]
MESQNHLLTWMTFWPLIGMAVILCTPSRAKLFIKQIAFLFTIPSLLCGLRMLQLFDPAAEGYQFAAKVNWIESFHIYYQVGADGLSAPLIFLTVLLCPICLLASWGINDRVKGYFSLFLLLETGMLGVFVALDFFLFYLFWELMLLPMYFLIGVWGGPRREYAAIKFFLYTLFGSVFLFIVMIVIYLYTGSFDLAQLGGQIAESDLAAANALKWWLFLALYVAFAIKIPAFPFHTWLPDAHVEAPTAISVILAGILLKMGTYGLLRISYPLLPDMAIAFAVPIAVIALINIVYGALAAMAQSDLKKLVAYSSISHMGIVMLGMAAMTREGMNGAVLQMFNHGTITAMLFLLVGVVYDRAHHRDIDGFGGLAKNMTTYAGFTAVAFFAALGLPGFSGFISEILCFIGGFMSSFLAVKIIAVLGTSGILLGAVYLLWTYQRMFLGPLNEKYADMPDCTLREIATLAPLAVIITVLGIFPNLLIHLFEPSMNRLTDYLVKFM